MAQGEVRGSGFGQGYVSRFEAQILIKVTFLDQTELGTFMWEPLACNLPRLTAIKARRCLAHKTVAFVGDSGKIWAFQYRC